MLRAAVPTAESTTDPLRLIRCRLMFGKVIHAEVDCTGEQATALWTRVCAWRAAVGLPIEAQLLGAEKAKPAGGFPVLPPRPAAPAD